ncbi:Tetratricopeptide repeat-like superfamily protein isoform 1 [Theobroma cacao]|uniref:Tetratricopeptide repeat-like superfamily protein isoform 1 n=1 Tax=Theobroma cacao TaxID=3641 RepID=A0A061DVA4_THECC|nr:Tetratricopeptide repeat-like superfamily protein isoform 1 [Theobroma cacao]
MEWIIIPLDQTVITDLGYCYPIPPILVFGLLGVMQQSPFTPASLRWSLAVSPSSTIRSTKLRVEPVHSSTPQFFTVVSSKRSPERCLTGPQRDPKNALSRIIRREAAIEGIGRKAKSKKQRNRLWPKAVLEALDDAIKENSWESALEIFGLLRKQHWYEPRCQTYTKLIMMLGKCKQSEQASLLFETMLSEGLKPTIDVYTALVNAYGKSGLVDEAFAIVEDMKTVSDCKPDVYTYSILINSCMKLKRFDLIRRILAEMSYLGIECSTVTYNTIIDGYGKAEMFEEMESSLTDMIESGDSPPDIFTFNSIVGAYGNSRQIEKMEKWYDEFQLMGIRPDSKTFNILIKSFGKAGMYEKMGSVMKFMGKRFFSPTVVTYNSVIEILGKAGRVEKMEEYFKEMKHKGMKPNALTYCSLVSAYSKARSIKKVDLILRQVENSDVILDTPFFNCIISAYGQAGDLKKMGELFLMMEEKKCMPDNITFATMIQAYNTHGMIEAAQNLENKLISTNKNSVLVKEMIRNHVRIGNLIEDKTSLQNMGCCWKVFVLLK